MFIVRWSERAGDVAISTDYHLSVTQGWVTTHSERNRICDSRTANLTTAVHTIIAFQELML